MSTTAAKMSPFLRDGLAVLETAPIRRLAARMVGPDQPDVLADVALTLIERDRAGKVPPKNVAAYVTVIVRRACLATFARAKLARCTPHVDPAMSLASPGCFPASAYGGDDESIAVDYTEPEIERVDDLIAEALDRIPATHAKQVRLTYWDEVLVRDRAGRGVVFGTAVAHTSRGRDGLRSAPEIAEAAELLEIGSQPFVAAPACAREWQRFVSDCERHVEGVQLVELIRVWSTLIGRELDRGAEYSAALHSTRRTAAEITGARKALHGWTILREAEQALGLYWSRAPGHSCERKMAA